MGSKVYSVRVPEGLAEAIDIKCREQSTNAASMLRKLACDYVQSERPTSDIDEGKTLVSDESQKGAIAEPSLPEKGIRQDFNTELEDIRISIGCINEAMVALTESVDDLCQRVAILELHNSPVVKQEMAQGKVSKPPNKGSILSFLFDDAGDEERTLVDTEVKQ